MQTSASSAPSTTPCPSTIERIPAASSGGMAATRTVNLNRNDAGPDQGPKPTSRAIRPRCSFPSAFFGKATTNA